MFTPFVSSSGWRSRWTSRANCQQNGHPIDLPKTSTERCSDDCEDADADAGGDWRSEATFTTDCVETRLTFDAVALAGERTNERVSE